MDAPQLKQLKELEDENRRLKHMYAELKPRPPDTEKDLPVIEVLGRLAEKHPRWGFRLMFDSLRREGHRWNHKRVHRVYT